MPSSGNILGSGDPTRLSLGKPSFKRRLEAYYRLVAPDLVNNNDQQQQPGAWRQRFDQIWDKYGGTHEGEAKLLAKLVKKYGSFVMFETVKSITNKEETRPATDDAWKLRQQDESWFELNEREKNSGCTDFLSDRFDPVAALRSSEVEQMEDQISHLSESVGILDRVEQFRFHLPRSDPLFREARAVNTARAAKAPETTKKQQAPSLFLAIAGENAKTDSSPYSILYEAAFVRKRSRIRVLIRHLHGIRGTLTGQLVAFDKHMNLILRDVDETYGPATAVARKDYTQTNAEQELQRRQQAYNNSSSTRQQHRRLAQVLVRGDNVVLIYFAAEEQSAWPITSKSPTTSMYRPLLSPPPAAAVRVGTPGAVRSLMSRRKAPPHHHNTT